MRELNIHKLVLNLNELCEVLEKDYNVNRGGCCYLAYIISRHLERLNIPYDLVVYDDNKRNKLEIEHEVLSCRTNKRYENSVTGIYTCWHYCLRIGGAGIVNPSEGAIYKYIIPEISSKNIKWIYKKGIWNNSYSKNNNRTIRRIVKEFFRKYEAY